MDFRNGAVALPLGLTTLRLFLGPVAIAIALADQPRWWYAPLLLIATLSDIFDGVIARKLGVSYAWLRRFDSITDVIFYACVFAATCIVAPAVVRMSFIPLALLAASELGCIAVSFLRFRVFPSVHAYSAKIYGLVLFAALLAVLAFDVGAWCFYILTAVGLLANAEEITILVLSKRAPVDVLSLAHFNRHTL